jgi:hypothetical protein
MVGENKLLETAHSCGVMLRSSETARPLRIHVDAMHVILSAPNSSPSSTVCNPMAPILHRTRIVISVLWIAVVFNAFKGYYCSHPKMSPFISVQNMTKSQLDRPSTPLIPSLPQPRRRSLNAIAGRTGASAITEYPPRTYISTRSQGAFAATL